MFCFQKNMLSEESFLRDATALAAMCSSEDSWSLSHVSSVPFLRLRKEDQQKFTHAFSSRKLALNQTGRLTLVVWCRSVSYCCGVNSGACRYNCSTTCLPILGVGCFLFCSVADRDPMTFWPQDPGWVKNQDPDPEWTFRSMFPWAQKQFFW